MAESIILRNIEGSSRLSGEDQHGAQWIQFEVDYGAEQQPGGCCVCGQEIESGWTCLDGGEECCDEHVRYERDAEPFIDSYVETALWSSTEDSGEPLDKNYGREDIATETLEKMRGDCLDFLTLYWDDVSSDMGRAGHDFWLTRNHHGAGFWDGDWPEELGRILTDAAHVYGGLDLYVGEDNMVHGQ